MASELSKDRMANNIIDNFIAKGIIPEEKRAASLLIWKEATAGIIKELEDYLKVRTTVTGTADLVTGEVNGEGEGGLV